MKSLLHSIYHKLPVMCAKVIIFG